MVHSVLLLNIIFKVNLDGWQSVDTKTGFGQQKIRWIRGIPEILVYLPIEQITKP